MALDALLTMPDQLCVLLDWTVSYVDTFRPNIFLRGLWEKSMYDEHSPSNPTSYRYWWCLRWISLSGSES